MSEHQGQSGDQQKVKPKHTVHDPLDAADKVSMHANGRPRMTAIFDTVASQIKTSLDEADKIAAAGGSAQDVIKVFRDTYDEYQKNRMAVLDKLDRVVTQ